MGREGASPDERLPWGVGALVWVRLPGASFPVWPGQVMDPKLASARIRKLGKPGRVLVSCFGDNSFSWAQTRQLSGFEENLETNAGKAWPRDRPRLVELHAKGVEEATELLHRRQGLPPHSNHRPYDFLHPPRDFQGSVIPFSADRSLLDASLDRPITAASVAGCSGSQARAWLSRAARGPSLGAGGIEEDRTQVEEGSEVLGAKHLVLGVGHAKQKAAEDERAAAAHNHRAQPAAARPRGAPAKRKRRSGGGATGASAAVAWRGSGVADIKRWLEGNHGLVAALQEGGGKAPSCVSDSDVASLNKLLEGQHLPREVWQAAFAAIFGHPAPRSLQQVSGPDVRQTLKRIAVAPLEAAEADAATSPHLPTRLAYLRFRESRFRKSLLQSSGKVGPINEEYEKLWRSRSCE